MLQMALKMATELDEPAVDLEGALTASTITATQSAENSGGKIVYNYLFFKHLLNFSLKNIKGTSK